MSRLPLTLALAILAVSCGNPHLTKKSSNFKASPAIVIDPLKALSVTNPDGLNGLDVKTNNSSINSILGAKNPNTEEILVTYAFEKGSNFRWNGGGFPGRNGSCRENQLPSVDCNLDVEFHADKPGIYQDNLIATYALKSAPETTKKVIIPLKGEKIASDLIPLTLEPITGGSGLELSTEATSVAGQVDQFNPNSEEVIVSYKIEDGTHFRFNGGTAPGTNGTCKEIQASQKNCSLDIQFFATEVGQYKDNLIATYALKSNPEVKKEVRLPLKGEKKAAQVSSLNVKPMSGDSAVDFGSAQINSPLRTDKVVIENNGNVPQELNIALLGGAPFAISHDCPSVLEAKQTCTVKVTYAPTNVGTHDDVIQVSHKKPSSASISKIKIPVTGTATAVPLKPGQLVLDGLNSGNLDFGTVSTGSLTSKIVEVKNIGEMPVTLKSQVLAGEAFSFNGGTFPGSRGTCGEKILPGKCLIEVAFRPGSEGSHTGSILLTDVAANSLAIGLRGKAKKHNEDCFKIEEKRVLARLSNSASGVVFPYLNSAADTKMKLTTLYGTSTNSLVQSLNRKTVKDGMVFVTFDIPASNEKIVEAELNVDVTKVIQDGHADTESLCLASTGIRKCSGREFSLASWQKLKNPAFWSAQSSPVNSHYEDEFSKGTSTCGNYTCYSMVKALSVKGLFELNKEEFISLAGQTIHFIFSDDTRLRTMPSLTIKTKKPIACSN